VVGATSSEGEVFLAFVIWWGETEDETPVADCLQSTMPLYPFTWWHAFCLSAVRATLPDRGHGWSSCFRVSLYVSICRGKPESVYQCLVVFRRCQPLGFRHASQCSYTYSYTCFKLTCWYLIVSSAVHPRLASINVHCAFFRQTSPLAASYHRDALVFHYPRPALANCDRCFQPD